MKIKVAIVDDHVGIREGYRTILYRIPYIDQIATYATSAELFQGLKEINFDLILLDIKLKNENGLEVCKKLKRSYPKTKVLIISTFYDEEYIINAYHFEAAGFLSKEVDLMGIRKAIDTIIVDNKMYFNNDGLQVIVNHQKQMSEKSMLANSQLSDKEIKVAKGICDGITTKELAKILSVEPSTINAHRLRIFKKLGIHKTAELINYMISHRLHLPKNQGE